MGSDTRKLFQNIRIDDAVAFRSLFDRWYTPLCHHAHSFLGDWQVSEDIVQELFITLWIKRDKLEVTVSERSYLYRSVRNRCLNYLRDEKRHPEGRMGEDNQNRLIGDSEPDPAMEEDHDEIMKKLHGLVLEAIRELPERCRVIFNLSRHSDLTNREIAQKLGLSEKTIENQITIALKKLRSRLGPHLDKIFLWMLGLGVYQIWG